MNATGSPRAGIHLEPKEIYLALLALGPADAGFFVDDWPGFLVCIVLSWLFVIALCWAHVGDWQGRVLFALAATVVYGGILYRFHQKVERTEQDDAFRNLSLEMQAPYLAQYPIKVFFTVRNGGATRLVKHRNTCIINALRDTSNAGIVVPKGVVNPWSYSPIGPGGDAMSDACGLEHFAFSNPFRCIDVTVKVEYALETQQDEIKEKEWRYVAVNNLGPHWFPFSTSNGEGNFCDGTQKY
jgi:hypothetical protein